MLHDRRSVYIKKKLIINESTLTETYDKSPTIDQSINN
jgi:hypothetical protein